MEKSDSACPPFDLQRFFDCRVKDYFAPGHKLDFYRAIWLRYNRPLEEVADAVFAVSPEASAVDIGANVGDTAAAIKGRRATPVLCIEGEKSFLYLLERNLSRLQGRSEIFSGFLSANLGENNKPRVLSGGTLSIALKVSSEEIPVTNEFESILKRYDDEVANPRLIKIDTDGMDFPIILQMKDFLKKKRPILFFEYAIDYTSDAEQLAIRTILTLIECGYVCFVVYDNYGNLLTTIEHDTERRFRELNRFLTSHRKFGRAIHYYDVCCLAQSDLGIKRSTNVEIARSKLI